MAVGGFGMLVVYWAAVARLTFWLVVLFFGDRYVASRLIVMVLIKGLWMVSAALNFALCV